MTIWGLTPLISQVFTAVLTHISAQIGPSTVVSRKAMGKRFGIKACQSVVRNEKRI
jgi:hypothetical protein